MSRHRGVRARQYSYDDYDEQDDESYEDGTSYSLEAQRKMLYGGEAVEGEVGAANLSSYFDAAQPSDAGDAASDAVLVSGIVAAIQAEYGKGTFALPDIEAAVRDSEYDLDTVRALLETSREGPPIHDAAGQAATPATPQRKLAAPPGLPAPSTQSAPGARSSWVGSGAKMPPVPFAIGASGGLVPVSLPSAVDAGMAPFSFDAPSQDDRAAFSGSIAVGGGGGGSGGRKGAGPSSGNGVAADAAVARLARLRVDGGSAAAAAAAAWTPISSRECSPVPGKRGGGGAGGIGGRTPVKPVTREGSPLSARDRALETALAEDDEGKPDSGDEATAATTTGAVGTGGAGRQRLSMVVVGHVDADFLLPHIGSSCWSRRAVLHPIVTANC
ncbi:unnamed protein product [Phaeothamnion confervicola]